MLRAFSKLTSFIIFVGFCCWVAAHSQALSTTKNPEWLDRGIAQALAGNDAAVICQAVRLPNGLTVVTHEVSVLDASKQHGYLIALLQCAQLDDPQRNSVHEAAWKALNAVNWNDPEDRRFLVKALSKDLDPKKQHNVVDEEVVSSFVIPLLGRIGTVDPALREMIVTSLLDCLSTCDRLSVGEASAKALGQIGVEDERYRNKIASALMKTFITCSSEGISSALVGLSLLEKNAQAELFPKIVLCFRNGDNIGGTAAHTILMALDNDLGTSHERRVLIDALTKTVDVKQDPKDVARVLSRAGTEWGLEQETIDLLFQFSESNTGDFQAEVFGHLRISDPLRRSAVTARLVSLLGTDKHADSAALILARTSMVLAEIAAADAGLSSLILKAILSRMNDADEGTLPPMLEALKFVPLDTPAQKEAVISVALRIPKRTDNGYVAVASGTLLATLATPDLAQADDIRGALVGLLKRDYGFKNAGDYDAPIAMIAEVFTNMRPNNPARAAVISALVERLAASRDTDRRYILNALTLIEPENPLERRLILDKALEMLGENRVFEDEALLAAKTFGPFDTRNILGVLALVHDHAVSEAAYWRALAISFSGAPSPPSANWFFLTFMGRPKPEQIPWLMVANTVDAVRYFKEIQSNWTLIERSKGLGREAADTVVGIISKVCPSEGQRFELIPWYQNLREILQGELSNTIGWIIAHLNLKDSAACWTNADKDELRGLQNKFFDAGFVVNAETLRREVNSAATVPTSPSCSRRKGSGPIPSS